MRTESSIALNGVSLESLDESIVIKGIEEERPTVKFSASDRFSHYGQDVNVESLTEKTVKVTFTVIQDSDKTRRFQTIDRVAAWAAGGGKLTVNYRINQYLQVRCEKFPTIKDKWSDELEMTFNAIEIPQWQALDEIKVIATGNTDAEIVMDGTAKTLLCVKAKNTGSGTISTIRFETSDEYIAMVDLGLSSGETFVMDYDENLTQRFRVRNTRGVWRSVLAKRYFTSSDDIHLSPGKNRIGLVSDANTISWVLSGRGRWLG